MSSLNHVIVCFFVSTTNGQIIERMHCIANEDGNYWLDNSPFYAFGVSYRDIISATKKNNDLVFSSVVARGGHSTYRVKLKHGQKHEFFLANWQELALLGCTYEGSSVNGQLYSIDVSPGTDVRKVYRVLEAGEMNQFWEFEEAHYFDPMKV